MRNLALIFIESYSVFFIIRIELFRALYQMNYIVSYYSILIN